MKKSEETRRLIIQKAAPIFNTKGYSSATIADITQATGMTKGAIYGNFSNKEEVAMEALEYTANKIFGLMQKEIRLASTAPEKLKALLHFYERYITNPPIAGGCPVLNTAVDVDDGHPGLRLKVNRMIETINTSLFKIMQRGVREKQLRADIDIEGFACMFIATLEGVIMLSRVQGDLRSYRIIKAQLEKQIDAMSLPADS